MIIDLLSEKGVSQNSLSQTTNVSPAYTNKVVTGSYLPSPEWLDVVSSTLGLDEETRTKLHRAAAQDLVEKKGYDIDLTRED